jgi:hypothetical protein
LSYRSEEKIALSKSDGYIFVDSLIKKGFKELYPQRLIQSIYFDNLKHGMFIDSEEGVLPRKKIRIRNYPNTDLKNFTLETKISSIEGRFKKTKSLDGKEKENFLKNGFFDNLYGNLNKCCTVIYNRSYFIKDQIRVTFDEDICYINGKSKTYEPRCVLEIKTGLDINKDIINSIISNPRTRFSKYCEAIKLLKIC